MRWKSYYIPEDSAMIWDMGLWNGGVGGDGAEIFNSIKDIVTEIDDTTVTATDEDKEMLNRGIEDNSNSIKAMYEIYIVREDNELFNFDLVMDSVNLTTTLIKRYARCARKFIRNRANVAYSKETRS